MVDARHHLQARLRPGLSAPRSGQSVADAFVVTWLIALGAETEQKKPI
jgi:hypothetical protein